MNRIKIISLVAIIVMVASFIFGCSTSNNSPTTPEMGNSSGNIHNMGIAAKQGDWVYFNSGEALYKEKSDGSERTLILNAHTTSINVANDWIYYVDVNDGGKILKSKTDGTGSTILNEPTAEFGSALNIHVVGEWIYFLTGFNEVSDFPILNKMKTDGTEKTVIGNNAWSINVVGDWIYYTDTSDGWKVYKMKTDGTGITELSKESAKDMNVYEEWIYYVDNRDYKIYKMKIDGTGVVKLSDDRASTLNVSDGWIFYTTDNEEILYKMKLDGTGKIKIDDTSLFPNIVGDWIYYNNYGENDYYYNYGTDNGSVYKIKTDGTGKSVTVSASEHVEDQSLTVSTFAKYADALVGEFDKTYDCTYLFGTRDYKMKIISFKALKELDGQTNVIVMDIEGSARLAAEVLTFFDKDGKRLPRTLGHIINWNTIAFSRNDINLVESVKYIVLTELDPEKNNGKSIAVFEAPTSTE